jgi:hypothetical protein
MPQMGRSPFHGLGDADLHRKRLAAHAGLLAVLFVTANLVAVSPSAAQTTVVHRVNAGGPPLHADPPWAPDTAAVPSPFLIGGANTFATTHPIDLSHPSVPSGTPEALFQSERWDPALAPEMAWAFPVDPGPYEVRLYFADIYPGTQAPGARVFDVAIEDALVLDDYDIFADVGGFRGVVKSFTVTSDGVLDIEFGHVAENPKVGAIEILRAAPEPSPLPTVGPSPSPPTTPEEITACLARPSITVLPANPISGFLQSSFPIDHTFDARARYDTVYPSSKYAVDVGRTGGGARACYIGGTYVGQQPRTIAWEESKAIGGAALRFEHEGGAYIAGLMVDNHHDGIDLRANNPTDPGSGDGWLFEHWYLKYIRDDAVAADDLTSGTVSDVLFDGVFVGFSAARDGSQPNQAAGSPIVLENVLIRLQEMPSAQYGMDHGHLLKWSPEAPRPIIRNSTFFIEDNAAGEWPPGTVLENVTLVWDPASGSAPSLDPMPGLTITTDVSVWEDAKQRWLERHGCTSFGNCARLLNPSG